MKIINKTLDKVDIGGNELKTGKTYRMTANYVGRLGEEFCSVGDVVFGCSTSNTAEEANLAVNLSTGRTLFGLLGDSQRFVEVEAEVHVK